MIGPGNRRQPINYVRSILGIMSVRLSYNLYPLDAASCLHLRFAGKEPKLFVFLSTLTQTRERVVALLKNAAVMIINLGEKPLAMEDNCRIQKEEVS